MLANFKKRPGLIFLLIREFPMFRSVPLVLAVLVFWVPGVLRAEEQVSPKRAYIDGTGPGWVALTEKDFVDVNGDEETWTFDGTYVTGTGKPIGVNRTVKTYKNFEIVYEWKHMKHAGNSGMFLWVQKDALDILKPNQLPRSGIEIQALDHGYQENWIKKMARSRNGLPPMVMFLRSVNRRSNPLNLFRLMENAAFPAKTAVTVLVNGIIITSARLTGK